MHMDINPEELQTNVVFSRLFQGMLKVLQNYISKTRGKEMPYYYYRYHYYYCCPLFNFGHNIYK